MTTQTRSTLDEAFVRELARAGVRAPLSVLTPEECVPVVERLWKEGFDEA